MAKANLRLQSPSSHTRIWSRVAVLDVIWGGLSPAAAYLLRDGAFLRPTGAALYCAISLIISVLIFQWFRTSSPISRFYSLRDARDLMMACVLIAALSAVTTFVVTRLEEAPRSIPILHLMVLACGLLGSRLLLRLRDTRRRTQRVDATKVEHVLIVEASRLAWFFSKMVEELAPGAYQIVAILDERPELKHRSLNGYPIIGTPTDLEKVVADYAMHGVYIDNVVLAAQPNDLSPAAWTEIRRVCQTLNIGLEILPERLISKEVPNNTALSSVSTATGAVFARSNDLRLNRPYWRVKRVIDVIVALTVAILLLPLIAAVTVLVLIDVGVPIVFWQQRVGRNGSPLHLYKFRTLHTLFDRATKERREAQEPSAIGRFLRRTRFDELPQLWNVLSGDMSLIGPRPLLPADQPDDFTIRLAVRPGLSGWAQVCGGNLISIDEKAALDEWYIRHASFGHDLNIIVRTTGMLLFTGDCRDENAIAAALRERQAAGIHLTQPTNETVPQKNKAPATTPALEEITVG